MRSWIWSSARLTSGRIQNRSTSGSCSGAPERKSRFRITRPSHARTHSASLLGGYFTKDVSDYRFGVIDHVADPHVAYLDIDRRACPSLRPVWIVLRSLGLRPVWIKLRRSRRGWHVVIRLRGPALNPLAIVALQAVCGSDARRETLNLMRVLNIERHGASQFWRARWNILYREKVRRRS